MSPHINYINAFSPRSPHLPLFPTSLHSSLLCTFLPFRRFGLVSQLKALFFFTFFPSYFKERLESSIQKQSFCRFVAGMIDTWRCLDNEDSRISLRSPLLSQWACIKTLWWACVVSSSKKQCETMQGDCLRNRFVRFFFILY